MQINHWDYGGLKIFVGVQFVSKSDVMMLRRKHRILIVDNSPDVTGAYKSISSLTFYLKDEFDFIFCLPRKSALLLSSNKLRPSIGVPFLEVSGHVKVLFYFPLLIVNSVRLMMFLKKNRIDALHVNDLYNMVGVVIKKIYPAVKVIYHVRLLPSSYGGKLYRFWVALILKYADHIIGVSETVGKCISGGAKLSIVYDSFDFKDLELHRRQAREQETIKLLYLANYTEGKGHDHAIRAFSQALQKNSSLRLVIAGGDLGLKKNRNYKKRLVALAAAEKVSDKIIFEDFIRDTSSLLQNADVFLNFSESESFSLTCLEALVYGTPLIATDSGGPAELFEPGVSGVLVPVGNVKAMSEAILMLCAQAPLRRKMAENAREHVRKNFSLPGSASQLKEVYSRVLKNQR